MTRLQTLFERKDHDVLSVYFTAGYPRLEDTREIIEALNDAGADLIEIGMPFSDPMADGPTIQESNSIALGNGMSISRLFDQLADIRKHTEIPLLLMGYLNPILQYGFERFCESAERCGIDAFIIPDIPIPEYLDIYKSTLDKHGLKLIFLITPQTAADRILWIDSISSGFIYLVTSSSVTGKSSGFTQVHQDYLKKVRDMNLHNPVLAGFGISDRDSFKMVCNFVRGGIIGSHFIGMLKHTDRNLKITVSTFVRSIKN